jgi:deoxycytidine triphosphate deaminase
MILGNDAIENALGKEWGWSFTNGSGIKPENLGPCSLDLTLSGQFNGREEALPFVDLPPHGTIHAFTDESIKLGLGVAGMMFSRSSLGRLFTCSISGSAGLIDPGYEGQITLEFVNHSSEVVRLIKGHSYCQIVFMQVMGCTKPYQGKYGGPKQTASDMMSKGVEK